MADTVPYLIRKGSERDAARIAEIHVETWRAAYRGLLPDEFLDSLDPVRKAVMWKGMLSSPGQTIFVALRDSHLVGFCDLLPSRDAAAPPEIAEIAAIYVEPSAWRTGAGRGLVTAALEHAREQRFQVVTLWVLSSNERGRAFYESLGFAPDGAEKTKDRPGFVMHEVRYRLGL
jgi:GNAT superfamily N-acetyltransferase